MVELCGELNQFLQIGFRVGKIGNMDVMRLK